MYYIHLYTIYIYIIPINSSISGTFSRLSNKPPSHLTKGSLHFQTSKSALAALISINKARLRSLFPEMIVESFGTFPWGPLLFLVIVDDSATSKENDFFQEILHARNNECRLRALFSWT